MKKFIKYFSFALLLIPSILLFAGCKKDEPETKSYAFYVAAEEGIQLTDSKGKLLQNIKKLETEGNTTYYIEVRNDKEADNIKLYINDSPTETTLTKVSGYDDEIVDGTNYQKVYSFVVPKVNKDTTIKVEGSTDKFITFEFDLSSIKNGYEEKGQTIANYVKIEDYDDTYSHLTFNEGKTITLRELIDSNRKITIPYNRIVDLKNSQYSHIGDLNFLRLIVDGGNKIYMTNNYFSPFRIAAFNQNSTITDAYQLGSDQGGAFGLSSVTGTSLENYLTLNLGNLKTLNLLKKTNVYLLKFADTDYAKYNVEYIADSKLTPFISFSTSEGGENTNLTHTYNKTTTVTLNLDTAKIEKAFGTDASTFISNIEIVFETATTSTTISGNDFVSGVYEFEILQNELPKVSKSFLLKYSVKNQTAYNIVKQVDEEIPSDAVTLVSKFGTNKDLDTTIHYAGYETNLTLTIDTAKFDPNFDFAFLGITVNGQEVDFDEAQSTYNITLATDAVPASGSSIVVKVFIKNTEPSA